MAIEEFDWRVTSTQLP